MVPPSSPSLALNQIKVLIVDDLPDVVDLFRVVLEAAGAEVAAATSVPAGMEILKSFKPDVLLSDIMMPGEDGFSLLSQLRSLEQQQGWSHIPILAITACPPETVRTLLLAAGFDGYMAKPVDPDSLVRTVANLVGR